MWVELSLLAGCLQTLRNAVARSLARTVPASLNSWARFAFNLPFAALLALGAAVRLGAPALPRAFFGYCLAGALLQLLANVALVSAFRRANFAESIALHKLEVVFSAGVGFALFGEHPSPAGWLGVLTCGAGVLLVNLGREGAPGWRRAFRLDAGGLFALTCAVLLAFTSFLLKEAMREFAAANPALGGPGFPGAVHTLFHATWMEVAILTAHLLAFRRGELALVPRHWRRMAAMGASAFGASLCWFWAFSLALVAYVRAVGQIESVLAVALALALWREREVWRQLPGLLLLGSGIGLVLLG